MRQSTVSYRITAETSEVVTVLTAEEFESMFGDIDTTAFFIPNADPKLTGELFVLEGYESDLTFPLTQMNQTYNRSLEDFDWEIDL